MDIPSFKGKQDPISFQTVFTFNIISFSFEVAAMADGREYFLRPRGKRYVLSFANRLIVNDARAMRVAEVMNDFRTIQHKISQYHVNASQAEYHLAGYAILRQCHAEAQAVLATHFDPGSVQSSGTSAEQTKRQLQRYAKSIHSRL